MTSRTDTTAPWSQAEARAGAARGRATRRGTLPEARRLADNETLALRPGSTGLSLRGRWGTFLVTQEGDSEDHVLGPGDEVRTTRRGLVVVWALSDGSLSVGPAGP